MPRCTPASAAASARASETEFLTMIASVRRSTMKLEATTVSSTETHSTRTRATPRSPPHVGTLGRQRRWNVFSRQPASSPSITLATRSGSTVPSSRLTLTRTICGRRFG